MSREIFVFFNFEKTNKRERERILFFSFFSFFVWVENGSSTKALFIIGLLRFLPLKGDFFASSNSRHRGRTVI